MMKLPPMSNSGIVPFPPMYVPNYHRCKYNPENNSPWLDHVWHMPVPGFLKFQMRVPESEAVNATWGVLRPHAQVSFTSAQLFPLCPGI